MGPSLWAPGAKRLAGSIALLTTIVLTGCMQGAPGESSRQEETPVRDPRKVPLEPVVRNPHPVLPVQVRSADGRSVRVTEVDRIVPLAGNLSEIVFSLGLGSRVVGRDISATFDEAKELPLVTRAHDVSAEALLSLEPSLVLAQTDTGPPEALEHVRASGVPVVVAEKPSSLADIGNRIKLVARAVGVPMEGKKLARRIAAEIETVKGQVPAGADRPRVAFLYMRGQAGVYLLGGKGAGPDAMIAAAGGEDAGTAIGLSRSFTPVTSEALVQARPDAILMTTTGLESVGGVDGLLKIPGISETPAGRNRRIITLEDGLLFSFGARTPIALGALIRKLYAAAHFPLEAQDRKIAGGVN